MKKNTKNLLLLTAATLTGMQIYNKIVNSNASIINALKEDDGQFYSWKEGRIFYTKSGNGKPLLLIHDLDSRASGEEWTRIHKKLSKNHTVYTIDLLGCGRSDKPKVKYTAYIYVQMITSFVKNVIKEKTDVIASNLSTVPVILANNLDKDIFDKIVLVNPVSLKQMEEIPDDIDNFKQKIINLPIVGTFIYNLLMNPKRIEFMFKNKYIHPNSAVNTRVIDAYYTSAHLNNSNGKYLYSSILSKYVNLNMNHAVKTINESVYILGSMNIKNNVQNLENYRRLNSNFEITHISNSCMYPQLDSCEKMSKILDKIL